MEIYVLLACEKTEEILFGRFECVSDTIQGFAIDQNHGKHMVQLGVLEVNCTPRYRIIINVGYVDECRLLVLLPDIFKSLMKQ